MSKLGELSLGLLLFFGFTFPFALSGLKAIVFALTLTLSGFLVVLKRNLFHFVDVKLVKACFFIIFLNLIFVLWGGVSSTEEAFFDSLRTYVVLPGAMFLFLIFLPAVFSYKVILWALILCSVSISYIIVFQALRVRGVYLFGEEFLWALYPGAQTNIDDVAFTGATGYLPRATEMLSMLIPFSAGLLVSKDKLGLNGILVFFVYLIVSVAAFMSERRVFLVLLLFVTFFCFLIILMQKKRLSFYIYFLIFILAGLGIGFYFDVEASLVRYDWVLAIGTSYDSFSDSTRVNQVAMLLEESLSSPIFGHGFGAGLEDGRRESPWRFEMIYVALFFQVGYLGAIVYLFLFVWILTFFYKVLKYNFSEIFPYFMVFLGVLFVASTNPYLSYGTGQARLLIPVLALNYFIKKN